MVEPASNAVPSSERVDSTIANGVRLVGESFLPGASLFMDGKLASGAAHAVVGLGFRAVLGPAGFLLAAADSYSKSVSDKYLWDHLGDIFSKQRQPAAETVAAETVEVPVQAVEVAPKAAVHAETRSKQST